MLSVRRMLWRHVEYYKMEQDEWMLSSLYDIVQGKSALELKYVPSSPCIPPPR